MATTSLGSWKSLGLLWTGVHAITWALAMLAPGFVHGSTDTTEILGLIAAGCLIGAGEWLVLSRRVPISGWWMIGFGLGWVVALKVSGSRGFFAPDVLWLGCGGGVLVGAQMWLALRRHVTRAATWLPVFVASSLLGTWIGEVAGFKYYDLTNNEGVAYLIGGACVGAAIGLLSSVPLTRMLKVRAEF